MKYGVAIILALVFTGLAASGASSTHANWSVIFTPLFLMDAILLLWTLNEMRQKKWILCARSFSVIILKFVGELLLALRLSNSSAQYYTVILIPMYLFFIALAVEIARHIYTTIL